MRSSILISPTSYRRARWRRRWWTCSGTGRAEPARWSRERPAYDDARELRLVPAQYQAARGLSGRWCRLSGRLNGPARRSASWPSHVIQRLEVDLEPHRGIAERVLVRLHGEHGHIVVPQVQRRIAGVRDHEIGRA